MLPAGLLLAETLSRIPCRRMRCGIIQKGIRTYTCLTGRYLGGIVPNAVGVHKKIISGFFGRVYSGYDYVFCIRIRSLLTACCQHYSAREI